MARYWGKFVASLQNGTPPSDQWETFFNAEVPGRALKDRARNHVSKVFYPHLYVRTRCTTVLEAFNEADMSAMMLMWLERDEPAPDMAPDEVWQLTERGRVVRTPWSSIIEPEPEYDDDLDDEPVIDLTAVEPATLWRPPTPDDVADRKVYLLGDQRPTREGAFSERQVKHLRSSGIRKPCESCGVVPNAFTLLCNC